MLKDAGCRRAALGLRRAATSSRGRELVAKRQRAAGLRGMIAWSASARPAGAGVRPHPRGRRAPGRAGAPQLAATSRSPRVAYEPWGHRQPARSPPRRQAHRPRVHSQADRPSTATRYRLHPHPLRGSASPQPRRPQALSDIDGVLWESPSLFRRLVPEVVHTAVRNPRRLLSTFRFRQREARRSPSGVRKTPTYLRARRAPSGGPRTPNLVRKPSCHPYYVFASCRIACLFLSACFCIRAKARPGQRFRARNPDRLPGRGLRNVLPGPTPSARSSGACLSGFRPRYISFLDRGPRRPRAVRRLERGGAPPRSSRHSRRPPPRPPVPPRLAGTARQGCWRRRPAPR